jgi:ATP citrate (pro-S)-lyase
LLRDSGAFTPDEAEEYIKVGFEQTFVSGFMLILPQIGTLNGLFVLGRSIGFIGHHLDQKRLRAPLYRHPAGE